MDHKKVLNLLFIPLEVSYGMQHQDAHQVCSRTRFSHPEKLTQHLQSYITCSTLHIISYIKPDLDTIIVLSKNEFIPVESMRITRSRRRGKEDGGVHGNLWSMNISFTSILLLGAIKNRFNETQILFTATQQHRRFFQPKQTLQSNSRVRRPQKNDSR